MRRNARVMLSAVAIALAGVVLTPLSAHAQTVSLAPPPGNELQFVAHVLTGTQNYTCLASGAWSAATPEATLADDEGEPIIKHFGTPAVPGPGVVPHWRSLEDGSEVRGMVLHARTVDTNAIPWLLLQAFPVTPGDLSNITFIQRKNTTGGLAPATPCGTVGLIKKVRYTADYFFWAAAEEGHDDGHHGEAGGEHHGS